MLKSLIEKDDCNIANAEIDTKIEVSGFIQIKSSDFYKNRLNTILSHFNEEEIESNPIFLEYWTEVEFLRLPRFDGHIQAASLVDSNSSGLI